MVTKVTVKVDNYDEFVIKIESDSDFNDVVVRAKIVSAINRGLEMLANHQE